MSKRKVFDRKEFLSGAAMGVALLLSACTGEDTNGSSRQKETTAVIKEDAGSETAEEEKKTEVEVKDGLSFANGVLIVNKKYGLPKDYAPGADPEMMSHLTELIQAMREAGFSISDTTSNFRSYEYQSQLYNNYVAQDGQEMADRYSARPGFSEHQSGLAADLIDASTGDLLREPKASAWLDEHAAEFGFIVRYKEEWEDVTGYMPESWHVRYLGKDLAPKVAEAGVPLETYLGVEGGDYRS